MVAQTEAWQTSKQVGALPEEWMFSLRFRGQNNDLHLRENLEESTAEGVGNMKEEPQKQDQASQECCPGRGVCKRRGGPGCGSLH